MQGEMQGFNLSLISNESMELKIIPSSDSAREMEKFDKEFLTFTWQPKSFEGDQLEIEIKFDYPLNISSSGTIRDRLRVTVRDPNLFRVKDPSLGYGHLSPESYQMTSVVAPQLLDD